MVNQQSNTNNNINNYQPTDRLINILSMKYDKELSVRDYLTDNQRKGLILIALKLEDIVNKQSDNEEDCINKCIEDLRCHFSNIKRAEKGRVGYYVFACLSLVKSIISSSYSFKYKTVTDLKSEYEPVFSTGVDDIEFEMLWQFANWMNVLALFFTPKKNKGIYLEVLTKITEGTHLTYVTGSGQTKATARRVFLYESECGIVKVSKPRIKKIKSQEEIELSIPCPPIDISIIHPIDEKIKRGRIIQQDDGNNQFHAENPDKKIRESTSLINFDQFDDLSWHDYGDENEVFNEQQETRLNQQQHTTYVGEDIDNFVFWGNEPDDLGSFLDTILSDDE